MPRKSDRLAQSAAIVRGLGLVIESYRHANHAALTPEEYDRLVDACGNLAVASSGIPSACSPVPFDELAERLDDVDVAADHLRNAIQRLQDGAGGVARAMRLVGAAEQLAAAFAPFDLGKLTALAQTLPD